MPAVLLKKLLSDCLKRMDGLGSLARTRLYKNGSIVVPLLETLVYSTTQSIYLACISLWNQQFRKKERWMSSALDELYNSREQGVILSGPGACSERADEILSRARIFLLRVCFRNTFPNVVVCLQLDVNLRFLQSTKS